MKDHPAVHTSDWYIITKDIIIPLIGILVAVVLGTIIASLLKRKEEKAKIKGLLIDTYMTYLNKITHFVNFESLTIQNTILNSIYYHFEDYFEPHANKSFQLKKIKESTGQIKTKIDSFHDDDYNWSLCTYKFAFLLGSRKYNEKAQSLENDIAKEFLNPTTRDALIEEIKHHIINDVEIIKGMKGISDETIDTAIDKIQVIVSEYYIKYQRNVFEPYSNTIADIIDSY